METYPTPHHGTRNPYLPHALYLVAPAETGAVQQQKLCALPQQTGWESRSPRAPEHPATDTQFGFFFSFPLKSWISRLTTHCQLFKEASRTLMSRRWELGQVPNCGSWAAAGHLQALTSSHRGSGLGLVQSLGMGLLTAVLISTSIPECSKRQAGLGGY